MYDQLNREIIHSNYEHWINMIPDELGKDCVIFEVTEKNSFHNFK